jgi:hypothetical protein
LGPVVQPCGSHSGPCGAQQRLLWVRCSHCARRTVDRVPWALPSMCALAADGAHVGACWHVHCSKSIRLGWLPHTIAFAACCRLHVNRHLLYILRWVGDSPTVQPARNGQCECHRSNGLPADSAASACAGAAESAGGLVDEDDAELQQALLLSLQPLALPNVRPRECDISHAFQRIAIIVCCIAAVRCCSRSCCRIMTAAEYVLLQ